jgi:Fic family protein
MIRVPVYNISNRLLSTVRAIGEACGEIKARPVTDTALAELLLEAQILSAHASAALAGHSLSLLEVRRRLQGDHTDLSGVERDALNYHKIRQALFRSVRSGSFELNLDTLDWLFTRTRVQAWRQPIPDVEHARVRFGTLIRFVNRRIVSTDPVILSGIFHRQAVLLGLDRYDSGQAIHLLTSALLGKAGLDMFEFLSIEYYYRIFFDRYLNVIGNMHNESRIDINTDFTEWLEYFAEGILHELHRVTRSFPKQTSIRPVLEPHLQRIIDHVERYGSISCQEFGAISLRGFQALTRDFDNLVRLGLIESKGQGQGIYYVLSQ